MAKLPKLTLDPAILPMLTGKIWRLFGSVQIDIHQQEDGEFPMSEAEAICADLRRIERQVKESVTREMLPLYEENWREYKTCIDGEWVVIDAGEVSEKAFYSLLRLETVVLEENDHFCFWFSPLEIFGDHSLCATMRGGLDGDIDTSLCG